MKLYVYDHCPFCVKARAVFGLKETSVELVILLNDDEATPNRMIGRKMAPILEHEGRYIPESMDIVAYVDGLREPQLMGEACNPRVSAWIEAVGEVVYRLAIPRWASSDFAEFATPEARAYFTRNKEVMIGPFADRMDESAGLVTVLNRHLQELSDLIATPEAVNGVLSADNVHLFAILRSISIVRGVVYPAKVEAYRARMAERTGIDLHDAIAR